MTLENHITSVLDQIGTAKDYPQVETIIVNSVDQLKDKKYIVQEYVDELEKKIENLSPIDLNSTQFSCFRYALIYLHNYVVFRKK
ncbi:hypothetical protein H7F33_10470 [Pedobacter sp. PAMC26386]|nr:hypothetical protein H7F33_10470 [Pedobacter sp. PAMC26386]